MKAVLNEALMSPKFAFALQEHGISTAVNHAAGLSRLESLILDHSHPLSSNWSFLQHLTRLTQFSCAAHKDALPLSSDHNIAGLLENAPALKDLQRYLRFWPFPNECS